jgi:two-component system OmpR family response regulator
MTSPARVRRLLIVEDDASLRELLRMRLELVGYQTGWAGNGADAFEQCRTAPPDAMILDINMPGLDGLKLLERLKRHGSAPPPTLMLTARHSVDDVKLALSLGAKDYLTKPFDDDVLLRRIARLLRTRPNMMRVISA